MKQEFNVYYSDGNHRIFEADNIVELLKYLISYDTNNTLINSITTRIENNSN